MPTNIGVIDLMMDTKAGKHATEQFDFLRTALKEGSKDSNFPVQYMFKDVPFSDQAESFDRSLEEEIPQGADLLLPFMDRNGVERAMIPVSHKDVVAQKALREHPDRFFGSYSIDPNQGMRAIRKLVDLYERFAIKAVTVFPCGYTPQVPANDKRLYPVYAKCVELDIPVCICIGVPGPRVPYAAQEVGLLDEVCYDFPELRVVMRHGAEPWTALAVKLMLKWPNLYYSTSAFAPKYYPKEIIEYANTRGSDKIMYAGYFPIGLSLDRIFEEMPNVAFSEEVWPKFLRENAIEVFKLDS
jgi:hypothetical protein